MIPELLVLATTLQAQALWMRDARAEYLASAMLYAAGTDLDDQAALLVSLVREGGTSSKVERCVEPGMGGWGAFSLAPDTVAYDVACGRIGEQSRAARWVFHVKRFDAAAPELGFMRYLGARSTEHPEVRARTGLFALVRWQLEHFACL